MEIVRERLEREFDLDLLVTAPTVAYQVTTPTGELVEVHNPADMPDELERVEEPYIRASIIVPKEYVGAVMELNNDRRGRFDHMEYLSEQRVHLTYDLPLAEIVLDYYDQLKSRTRGYASFDYDLAGYRAGPLVRVDVLVGGEPVDALSLILPREGAYPRAKVLVERLREEIPRQFFDVADPGGDRLARDRARDREGQAQGRAREVLRRRHHAQAQAAREAEGGQEADEAGRLGRGAAGGVPRRAQPGGRQAMSGVRHLYVHLPFCAHRCGYCDFVTAVGLDRHGPYVDGLLAELELERGLLAPGLDTVFLGGGTPTFTEPEALARLLAALPAAAEVTVEANPETVTPALAALLREAGVTASRSAPRASSRRCSRCSSALRARTTSAAPSTLSVMPDSTTSHSTSSTGFPARAPPTSSAISPRRSRSSRSTCPATSSRRSRGRASRTRTGGARTPGRGDGGLLRARRRALTGAGYRWYETANFCRPDGGRDLRAHHNLGLLEGATTSASGSAPSRRSAGGAGGTRRGAAYLAALCEGAPDSRDRDDRRGHAARARDARAAPRRAAAARRARRRPRRRRARAARAASGSPSEDADDVALTPRPLLGGGVTAELSPDATVSLHTADAPDIDRAPAEILRGVVEEYVATGQPVGSRTSSSERPARLAVDRACRARRARGAQAADAPAHLRRPPPDRAGYRYYVDELIPARAAAAGLRARPRGAAARSTPRCRRRPRCSPQ